MTTESDERIEWKGSRDQKSNYVNTYSIFVYRLYMSCGRYNASFCIIAGIYYGPAKNHRRTVTARARK